MCETCPSRHCYELAGLQPGSLFVVAVLAVVACRLFVVAVVDVVDVVAVARSVDVAPSSSLTNLAAVCSHIENGGLRGGQMISIEQMTKK